MCYYYSGGGDIFLPRKSKKPMKQPPDVPLLFTFYFGDSASTAHQGASRRFKKWSCAFDEWVVQLRRDLNKNSLKQPLIAWRRLVRQCGKMPWQLTPADINQHLTWMRQEGFAVSTVNDSIVFISGFYQWCAELNVDPTYPTDFNPAKGIACTKRIPYRGKSVWSQDELNALLAIYQRDPSPLGKRDYACILMRLNSGVTLNRLLHLTWGQIEQAGKDIQVRWRKDGNGVFLPVLVWQAVLDYLTLSGRLERMLSGSYIFVSQVQPVMEGAGGKAEDWVESKPVSYKALLYSLKLYGRKVGIAEEKLTMMALRRTSMRLRLNQGETLEGMQLFMDTREELKFIKYRLAGLPGLPEGTSYEGQDLNNEIPPPLRGTKPFQGWEGTTHGFYSRHKDIQAVRAVMAKNLQGIDQEISCLRELMRLLLEREGDEAKTIEAYSQAAQRLIQLISAARSGNKGEVDTWVEENLRMLDKIAAQLGYPPVSSSIRQEALGLSAAGDDAAVPLTEEIATIRLLLRNLYTRATAACQDDELMHLLNLYGKGCIRLAKLEKLCGGEQDALARYLQNAIDKAIREVAQEFPAIRNDKQDIEPGL